MKGSQEKARELVGGFACLFYDTITRKEIEKAKKGAIKCVEEILSSCPTCPSDVYAEDFNDDYKQVSIEEGIQARTYWEDVLEYIHLM